MIGSYLKLLLSFSLQPWIWNCTFAYFLEIVETCFLKKNLFKIILYIYIFYPKTSNFHNSGMVSRKKLSDLPLNNIFSVLSIGLQYTLSFKWPDFGLKCRVTIMPKDQSLTLIWREGETAPWYVLLYNVLVTYSNFIKFGDFS